jgi:hypothetical protein
MEKPEVKLKEPMPASILTNAALVGSGRRKHTKPRTRSPGIRSRAGSPWGPHILALAAGQTIAEICPRRLRGGREARHYIGMFICDVFRLANVGVKIIQRHPDGLLFILCGVAVAAGLTTCECSRIVRKDKLPTLVADGA